MKRGVAVAILASTLAAFILLSLGNIRGTSATNDETTHLAAGWSYLVLRDFRMNAEHPPLMKLIAAAPLMWMNVWPAKGLNDGSAAFRRLSEYWQAGIDADWPQWAFAHQLLYGIRDGHDPKMPKPLPRSAFVNPTDAMFVRARVAVLFAGVSLALIVFFWSYELWGAAGAVLSALLFCFDPNFIAHSGLVTTDVGVSFFMTAAVYFFWRCTRHFSALNVIAFALCLALAQIAKFSAVILVADIVILAAIVAGRRVSMRRLMVLAVAGVIAGVAVIWAVYGFRFMAASARLPIDSVVRGSDAGKVIQFATRHHLLPEGYLLGFARMRQAVVTRSAYLFGENSGSGFRTYYIWTTLTKVPVPTLIAIAAAFFVVMRRHRRFDVLFLLIPAVVYFAIAVASNLNIGHRHILPVFPFLYVLCGVLGARWIAAGVLSAMSCVVVFTPFDIVTGRHLSYFNELAGGPRRGHRIVVDSNLDWGQDLPRLASWLRARHISEPVDMVWFGSADPRYHGIPFRNLHGAYYAAPELRADEARTPGWLVISATHYAGAPVGSPSIDFWRNYIEQRGAKLAGRAGYSIFIFRLDK